MCISIPGQVVQVHDADLSLVVVDVQGTRQVVNMTAVVADAQALAASVGTWVLMRSGMALAQVSDIEARRSLEVLALMQGLMDDGGHP